MTRRPPVATIAFCLLLASQASSAVLLTTPEQSVFFCVGSCGAGLSFPGITVVGPLGSNSPNDESETRSFSSFNTSLGILRSVTFTLDSTLGFGLVGIGFVDPDAVVGADDFSLSQDPKLSLLGFDPLFDPTALVGAITASDFIAEDDFPSPKTFSKSASMTRVLEAPTDDLGLFLTGSSFGAQFSHRLVMNNRQADNVTLVSEATWSGTLKVQYGYETRPTEFVPEPGTLALVGLGLLAGVTGTRRRGRVIGATAG